MAPAQLVPESNARPFIIVRADLLLFLPRPRDMIFDVSLYMVARYLGPTHNCLVPDSREIVLVSQPMTPSRISDGIAMKVLEIEFVGIQTNPHIKGSVNQ